VMNISLTPKGIKAQNKIHKILEDCEHIILKRMSKSDIESFTISLNKISDILINN
jgi:DNA-binding MarR family transcriptional regulator